MIGFPYNYEDELSEEESVENFKFFLKNYGLTLCVNGILILLSKAAYAADKPGPVTNPGPGNGEVVPSPKPADPPPVSTPLVPPTGFVYSKKWAIYGLGAIGWICITAASTGNPALIVASSSLLLYAIGATK